MSDEMAMVPVSEWEWYGHAGHLIVGDSCRFHMATKVGPWWISTVGEYWPPRSSREIHAEVHDPTWLAKNRHRKGDDFDYAYMRRFGYETIGHDRKYETMVFRVAGGECLCGCGLPQFEGGEVDFAPYNDAKAARAGHMEMCAKYARRPHPSPPPTERTA